MDRLTNKKIKETGLGNLRFITDVRVFAVLVVRDGVEASTISVNFPTEAHHHAIAIGAEEE